MSISVRTYCSLPVYRLSLTEPLSKALPPLLLLTLVSSQARKSSGFNRGPVGAWAGMQSSAEAHFLSSWCRELGAVATSLGYSSTSAFVHTVPMLRDTLAKAQRLMHEKAAPVRDLSEVLSDTEADSGEPKSMAKTWRKLVVARSMN